jgi:hypothetical protein
MLNTQCIRGEELGRLGERMLKVEQVHVIRHKVLLEGQSQRKVARDMGLSRNTVKKYLEVSEPKRVEVQSRPRPVLDRVKPRIDQLLEEWAGRTTAKQRLTGSRLHLELVREGFQVVMAMNLGQGYAVNTLDRALLDRFPCVLEFQYLSSREEEDLLVAETEIDREVARSMVKVANETRKLRRNRELSGELTPRGLFAWARKFRVKRGSLLDRLQDAASTTWLHQVAGVDADGYLREDASASILSLIEAHTGSR